MNNKIFIFLLIFEVILGKNLKLEQEEEEYVMGRVSDLQISIEEKLINNTVYQEIELEGASFTEESGKPKLPYFSFVLGIPLDSEPYIEVTKVTKEEKVNIKVLPVPFWKLEKRKEIETMQPYFVEDKIYTQDKFYPETIVKISSAAYLRSQRVIDVYFYPIRYNPIRKLVEVNKEIEFKIYFNSYLDKESKEYKEEKYFEHIYRNVIINYEQAKKWRHYTSSSQIKRIFQQDVNNWYKVEIQEEGIYKISYEELKEKVNLSPFINLERINLYGNDESNYFDKSDEGKNGQRIPEEPKGYLAKKKPIPIYIKDKNNDGVFNQKDEIIFYGISCRRWDFNKERYYSNPYEKENVYWLNFNSPLTDFSRITQKDGLPSGNEVEVGNEPFLTSVYLREENEFYIKERPGVSPGQDKCWKSFSSLLNVEFPLSDNIAKGKEALIFLGFNKKLEVKKISINGKELVGIVGTWEESNIDSVIYFIYKVGISSDILTSNNKIELEVKKEEKNIRFFFLKLNYYKEYKAQDNYLIFTNPEGVNEVRFKISNFSSFKVDIYDITNPLNIAKINNFSYKENIIEFKDNIPSGSKKQYIILPQEKLKTPFIIKKKENTIIPPQSGKVVDYLIIADKLYFNELMRLKQHRISKNNFKVEIVSTEEIYDEYSFGLVDPTAIRNFIKDAKDYWKTEFVVLVGNANVNFFDMTWLPNLMPTYYYDFYTDSSLSKGLTDNWYTFLTDDKKSDIMLGRLPCNSFKLPSPPGPLTDEELKNVIDKIIQYENEPLEGEWASKVLLLADDCIQNGIITEFDRIFWQNQQELQYKEFTKGKRYIPSYYQVKKIYVGDYTHKEGNLEQVVYNALNQGCFLVSYGGHGGVRQFADERLFGWHGKTGFADYNYPNISLFNNGKLPLFLSESCYNAAFHWQDKESLAEKLLTAKDCGGIGMIATTGTLGYSGNATKNFIIHIFYDKKENEWVIAKNKKLGQIFFESQIEGSYAQNSQYVLIGDPGLTLGDNAPPSFEVKADTKYLSNYDYLNSNTKEIEVKIYDVSGVSDKIKVKEDNKDISFNFIKENETNHEKHIVFSPKIREGEYKIEIEAEDNCGNKGLFVINISSEFKIKEVVNFPNPFNEKTYITYFLTDEAKEVKIKIYTLSGRLVKVIEDKGAKAGLNRVLWDAKDEEGLSVANGVYFYKIIAQSLQGNKSSQLAKMVVLKNE